MKKISKTFHRTRGRYRSFRSKLSQDISKTNVLPKELQQRLMTELDKRLDVDLDELLSSPKLRVKLSPAKLDKLLLELYDGVIQGSSGDVFRVIGGGSTVGRQNLYVKQKEQQLKEAEMQQYEGKSPPLAEDHVATLVGGGDASTPTSLVKRALKRNLPQNKWTNSLSKSADVGHPKEEKKREVPKMSLLTRSTQSNHSSRMVRPVRYGGFTPKIPPRTKFSSLI